jgi:hypothetical protein
MMSDTPAKIPRNPTDNTAKKLHTKPRNPQLNGIAVPSDRGKTAATTPSGEMAVQRVPLGSAGT